MMTLSSMIVCKEEWPDHTRMLHQSQTNTGSSQRGLMAFGNDPNMAEAKTKSEAVDILDSTSINRKIPMPS